MKPKHSGIRRTFYAVGQPYMGRYNLTSQLYKTREEAEHVNGCLRRKHITGFECLEVVRVEITPV